MGVAGNANAEAAAANRLRPLGSTHVSEPLDAAGAALVHAYYQRYPDLAAGARALYTLLQLPHASRSSPSACQPPLSALA